MKKMHSSRGKFALALLLVPVVFLPSCGLLDWIKGKKSDSTVVDGKPIVSMGGKVVITTTSFEKEFEQLLEEKSNMRITYNNYILICILTLTCSATHGGNTSSKSQNQNDTRKALIGTAAIGTIAGVILYHITPAGSWDYACTRAFIRHPEAKHSSIHILQQPYTTPEQIAAFAKSAQTIFQPLNIEYKAKAGWCTCGDADAYGILTHTNFDDFANHIIDQEARRMVKQNQKKEAEAKLQNKRMAEEASIQAMKQKLHAELLEKSKQK